MLDCVPAHQPQADAFYNVGFMSLEGESHPHQLIRALSLSLSPSLTLACVRHVLRLSNKSHQSRPTTFQPVRGTRMFFLPLISPYRNLNCLWRRCKLNVSKIIPNSKFTNRTQVCVSLGLCVSQTVTLTATMTLSLPFPLFLCVFLGCTQRGLHGGVHSLQWASARRPQCGHFQRRS